MKVLPLKNRQEFRAWLQENSKTEKECWLCLKRGKPVDEEHFWYLDAVEEALCFGWIDSTTSKVDGVYVQRFSPRGKNSPWTELNKERVRRLERLGLMTEEGRKVLPEMGKNSFQIDPEIEKALKEARTWSKFKAFPKLYQRVRAYNVMFYKTRNKEAYQKALSHLVDTSRNGEMFGQWNDYGRLLEERI